MFVLQFKVIDHVLKKKKKEKKEKFGFPLRDTPLMHSAETASIFQR